MAAERCIDTLRGGRGDGHKLGAITGKQTGFSVYNTVVFLTVLLLDDGKARRKILKRFLFAIFASF